MMDFLAREAVITRFEPRPGIPQSVTNTMNMALQQGLPMGGEPIRVEWHPYLAPPAPIFAHLQRERFTPRLLVEFDDADHG